MSAKAKKAIKSIGIVAGLMRRAGVEDEYSKLYRTQGEAERLSCRRRCGRPAPAVEFLGEGWCSLVYCNVCQGEMERAERAKGETERQQRELASLRRAMLSAGLTDLDIDAPYELDPIWQDFCRDGRGKCWAGWLWGPPGTGKTTELALAVRHYVRRGWRCVFIDEPGLLDSLRPGEGQVPLSRYLQADLLAIDEVGASSLTSWGIDQLNHILRQRSDGRHRKVTLCSSNLPLMQLQQSRGPNGEVTGLFDGRVIDRLHAATAGDLIVKRTYNYRIRREEG